MPVSRRLFQSNPQPLFAVGLASLFAVALLAGGCRSAAPTGPRSDGSSPASDEKATQPLPAGAKTYGQPKPADPGLVPVKLNTPVEPEDAAKLGYAIRWFSVAPALEAGTLITLVGSHIMFTEPNRHVVHAYDFNTGAHQWTRQVSFQPEEHLFAPVEIDGIIYVNSNSWIYRLDSASGLVLPPVALPSAVGAGPSVAGRYLVFGGLNGRVMGFNTRTGFVSWEYRMQGGVKLTPVVSDRQVLAMDATGKYVMLNHEGRHSWTSHTWGIVSDAPIFVQGTLLITSEDRTLYAVNSANGQDLWKYADAQIPLKTSPFVCGRHLVLSVPGRDQVVLQLTSGKAVANLPMDAKPVCTTREGQLMTHQGSNLKLVELPSGKSKLGVNVRPLAFTLQGPNSSVILVGEDRQILRLDPKPQ